MQRILKLTENFTADSNMKRRKYKYIACACALVLLCLYYFYGLNDYMNTKSFEKDFDYPLNIDLRPIVEDILAGKKPAVKPINYYPYRFLSNSGKCRTLEKLDLFIVVKSAMYNFGHRNAIRQTYGQENQLAGRIIKILFFLGIDESPKTNLQKQVEDEMIMYKDIIQADFRDSYYNNTIKTMMSFRWVFQHCSTADFYLFTDDDMYISLDNLLNYVSDQLAPEKFTDLDKTMAHNVMVNFDVLKEDRHIFAGYVFKSAPHRYRTSKWRVSIEEYPWNSWPPYVTAGAYVISNKSMKTLYVGSLFVKHFRFDDIYLGIVAKKVGLLPTHCPHFYFYKKPYDKEGYKDVIASHGYGDHEELIRVWTEQNKIS